MTESTVVGAAVIVYRQFQGNVDFLILHRSHSGPDFEGDWAWGPPSGRIGKGESAIECAIRELQEETGLALDLKETNYGPAEFVVFTAEAGGQEAVVLSDEHVVRIRLHWQCLSEPDRGTCCPTSAWSEPWRIGGVCGYRACSAKAEEPTMGKYRDFVSGV